MLDWIFGAGLAIQGLSIGDTTENIETTLQFERSVEICIIGPYQECSGDMCYSPPEGTFALVAKEHESARKSVFLFSNSHDDAGKTVARYYVSDYGDHCLNKEAGETISFDVRQSSQQTSINHTIWIE